MPSPRVVVTQLGARRDYLTPSALHQGGMLEHFYTDIFLSNSSAAKRLGRWGRHVPLRAARRLAARAGDLPAEKVTAFWWFGLQYRLAGWRARRKGVSTPAWLWGGQRFCRLILERGLGSGTAVYAYSSAALELFVWAKARGLRCILDHATAPKRQEDALVRSQAERYPGWTAGLQEDPWAEAFAARQRQECELADLVLCGSTFVENMVRREVPHVARTEIVPLGLRCAPTERRCRGERDQPLRVLFVGDEAIRKGLGDLCAALRKLPSPRYEARVAGQIDLTPQGREEASQVARLLGHVPRGDMPALFDWADVLVLPSVSDTFGLVLLEAMSYGAPVIATPNTAAPDIVRHEVDGFLTPVMDPDALAGRLATLDADRERLEEMSQNAFARAKDFSLTRYVERVQNVLRTL